MESKNSNNQRPYDVSSGSKVRPKEIFTMQVENTTNKTFLKIFKFKGYQVWIHYPNLKILGGFFEKLSDAKLFVSKASKAILKGKFIFSSHCNIRNYYPASYCCNCSANVYGWEIDRDEIQKQHEHVGLSKNFFNKCRIE